MSVLALCLAAAVAAAHDGRPNTSTVSTDFVTSASTKDLAKAVLPPEIAAKVIGHQLNPPYLHWLEGYPARFWTEAIMVEPGFCRRETYYVPMTQRTKGTLTPSAPSADAQIAMTTDCSDPSAAFFALNRSPPEKVIGLLRWLQGVHRTAASRGELNVDIDCRSELDPNPCTKGARRVLAELSIQNVSIVQGGSRASDGEDWRVSIKSDNAPGRYWQLSIFDYGSDRPRVRISWDVIPPY
jgi:hypothetical protein